MLLFSILNSQFSIRVAAQPWHDDPTAIGAGRELPRTMFALEERFTQPVEQWEQVASDSLSATFRAAFKVPFAWVEREVFLRVPSAAGAYQVSVNGTPAGYTASAHGASEWNVTKLAREGNNTLEVRVLRQYAGRAIEQYGPATIAARPPAGATILSQPRVRVRDLVVEADYLNGAGQLRVGAVVATHLLNPKQAHLHYALYAPDSTRLYWGHRDVRLAMRGQDTVAFFHRIDLPELWSAESPRRYTLVLRLQQEGRYTETITTRIGIRHIDYRGNALVVNGQETPMQVVEFAPSGDLRQDLVEVDTLKAQGVNTLLLAHHPACEEFYELCDSIGIYLVDRADIDTRRAGNTRLRDQNPTNMPLWRAAYLDRVAAMYHRSKLHPSVVAFALAGRASNGYNLYESYLLLKQLEPHRPIVYLGAEGEWNSDADPDPGGMVLRWREKK